MEWVVWFLAVVVLGLGAIVASGRWGQLPPTITDAPRPHVPEGALTGDDLRDCRIDVVSRGYSMVQVDELLDRLSDQLDLRAGRHDAAGASASLDKPVSAGDSAFDASDAPIVRRLAELDESLFVPETPRALQADPLVGDVDQWQMDRALDPRG